MLKRRCLLSDLIAGVSRERQRPVAGQERHAAGLLLDGLAPEAPSWARTPAPCFDKHLQAYLDEFAFRHNRRKTNGVGRIAARVIESIVAHEPLTMRALIDDTRRCRWFPSIHGAQGDFPSGVKALRR